MPAAAAVLLLLLLAAPMVGRGRDEGGGSGGARKGTGPKLKMDAETIAKREKKMARKAAKESLAAYVAEEKEKYESVQAWRREGRGPSTRSLSSRQQPTLQAATASSSAAASSSAVPVAASADPRHTMKKISNLYSYFTSSSPPAV